jgi:hypothetical protein
MTDRTIAQEDSAPSGQSFVREAWIIEDVIGVRLQELRSLPPFDDPDRDDHDQHKHDSAHNNHRA